VGKKENKDIHKTKQPRKANKSLKSEALGSTKEKKKKENRTFNYPDV